MAKSTAGPIGGLTQNLTQAEANALLLQVEELLRSMPTQSEFDKGDHYAWLGRATAVLTHWSPSRGVTARQAAQWLGSKSIGYSFTGYNSLALLLHEAQHDLLMRTTGPLTVAVDTGKVFDYFDEVRNLAAMAKLDILFVDPYLEADFVQRYLPHVAGGVSIRLLAREKLSALLPAVDLFAKQNRAELEVRSAANFHDRYVFIDRTSCYQSGASFKDGARNAPTTLTQITDAFQAMLDTYERLWQGGKVERS